MTVLIPEKTLSLGDLVGLSYRIVRQNWQLFLKWLFWPSLVYGISEHGILAALNHWVGIAPTSALSWTPFLLHIGIAFPLAISWAVAAWILSVRCCALTRFLLGLDETFQQAYNQLKARTWDIFIAFNLAIVPPLITLGFWIIVSGMAFVVVNRLSGTEAMVVGALFFGVIGFGLTVTMAFSGLFGSLLLAVVAFDLVKVKEAAGKSWFCMQQRLMRGGSFACLLTISLVLFYLAFESPLIIYEVLNELQTSEGQTPPLPIAFQILSCGADIIANLLIFPVAYGGYMLFYRDLKLRLEGYDLSRRLAILDSQ